MRDETKEVLDLLIDRWAKNKLGVFIKVDQDKNEIYTFVKNKKGNDIKNPTRRISDKIESNQKIPSNDIVCSIKVVYRSSKVPVSFVYYKSSLAIDSDIKGTYDYLRKFLALIRLKTRQMNVWGIKVQLGEMTVDEFYRLDETFVDNKESFVNELFHDSEIRPVQHEC